jgi:large subunit ribosomal protein L25
VLLHIDFQVVSLTEKIRAKINIELTGLPPAVKNFNAVAINGLSEIEVEAFPQDLPERIVLDISKLENIGDGIYVRDLDLSDDIEILTDREEMIVFMTSGTSEEEVEEALETTETEPEVIEKGKKEEDEEEE